MEETKTLTWRNVECQTCQKLNPLSVLKRPSALWWTPVNRKRQMTQESMHSSYLAVPPCPDPNPQLPLFGISANRLTIRFPRHLTLQFDKLKTILERCCSLNLIGIDWIGKVVRIIYEVIHVCIYIYMSVYIYIYRYRERCMSIQKIELYDMSSYTIFKLYDKLTYILYTSVIRYM